MLAGQQTPSLETLPQLPRVSPLGAPVAPRRTSFNFLRRSKSGDMNGDRERAASGSGAAKLSKRSRGQLLQGQAYEDLSRQQPQPQQQVQPPLPRLSTQVFLPRITPFDAGDSRPASIAIAPVNVDSYPRNLQRRYAMSSPVSTPPSRMLASPNPRSSPGYTDGEYVDPYARTESMTHRGRYSYAVSPALSNVNSPRRVRRRKDPTPFNVLVIGAKNSGKTSFINFLRTSLALPSKKRAQTTSPPRHPSQLSGSPFTSCYLETEIDGERVGVTIWDSQGMEQNIVDLQLREMSSFIESKFEDTFAEERKVNRAPGVQDTHIHCVFLLLDPLRLDASIASSQSSANGVGIAKFSNTPRVVTSLNEDLDLQVLRTLQRKTTVIPIISKADTITSAHMDYLKRTVWDTLKRLKLDPLEALDLDLDGSDSESDYGGEDRHDVEQIGVAKELGPDISHLDLDDSEPSEGFPSPTSSAAGPSPAVKIPGSVPPAVKSTRNGSALGNRAASDVPELPLSIISPDTYDSTVVGRRFPWGVADPYDPAHCDFTRLKDSVFREWRGELRSVGRDVYYEGWRTSRLNSRGNNTPARTPARTSPLRTASVDAGKAMSLPAMASMDAGRTMSLVQPPVTTPMRVEGMPYVEVNTPGFRERYMGPMAAPKSSVGGSPWENRSHEAAGYSPPVEERFLTPLTAPRASVGSASRENRSFEAAAYSPPVEERYLTPLMAPRASVGSTSRENRSFEAAGYSPAVEGRYFTPMAAPSGSMGGSPGTEAAAYSPTAEERYLTPMATRGSVGSSPRESRGVEAAGYSPTAGQIYLNPMAAPRVSGSMMAPRTSGSITSTPTPRKVYRGIDIFH